MLNQIPGIYITGEHVVTHLLRTNALLGLAAPSGARGEVTGLESSDYHREVSPQHELCAMQSVVKARMGEYN
eukprot:4389249-Pyramimonas_sp.AAC.1